MVKIFHRQSKIKGLTLAISYEVRVVKCLRVNALPVCTVVNFAIICELRFISNFISNLLSL